jgi:hypothetical protein
VNRGKILTAGLLVLVAAVLWWWLGSSSKQKHPGAVPPTGESFPSAASVVPEHTPQTINTVEARQNEAVAKVEAIFATPITFYGKVIDQNGHPVSSARAEFDVIDNFFESGSKYQRESDAVGLFTISGIKGSVLTVAVTKEGYYYIHGKSNGSFGYGMGADTTRREPPTKDNPSVFVLQKRGSSEPLIRADGGQINVPRTGRPLNVDLETGRAGRGDLQIETWIGDSTQQRFDWRYRLSVPGGGLVERNGQFDFQVPEDGYQPVIEVKMPASGEQWSKRPKKEYFARLADGRYARFSIRFYAGNRNFVVLESYLNPKSGNRNLEFDPRKALNPQ